MADLTIKNLSLQSSDGQCLLRNIDCKLHASQVNMILGPNGAGKTLLLKCIAGILKPSSGEIWLGKRNLRQIPIAERSMILGWLPSQSQIPFTFQALDIVIMGRFPYHHGHITQHDRHICLQTFTLLGIEDLKYRNYESLSQGEQIKVQLARILAANPDILVLDEICANLDIKAKIDILQLLSELSAQGKTIILSHHDLHSVFAYANQLVMLKNGKVAAQGPVSDSFTPSSIEKVFGIKPRIWKRENQDSLSLLF